MLAAANAETATHVRRIVSADGKARWVDLLSGERGRAVLTFGHIGCAAVDSSGQCTSGVWPSIPGASWIWKSQRIDNKEGAFAANVRFNKVFRVPSDATSITATLRISADNSYVIHVNGVRIGSEGTTTTSGTDQGWATIETYAVPLNPGTNRMSVRVTNYAEATSVFNNPAGLIYKLRIVYTE
jgi:hypothetical protein